MKVLVIDGQGGKLGRELIERIRAQLPDTFITAVGTNSLATQAMLKASPDEAATGENPVVVSARFANVILGPVGIAIADSFVGEVTPAMALAVAQSRAKKILIPFNRCDTLIAGAGNQSGDELIADAIQKCKSFVES